MYSHVTVGTNDAGRAIAFYDAVLGILGHARFHGDADAGNAGYGIADDDQFWVLPPYDDRPATVGNGTHIAFLAPTRDAVRRCHAAALENGGRDEGLPGPRERYHPSYYGAYFRDPDGNKLQVVCHAPETVAGP